ncbi:hypothetical protein FNV43_RR22440 [Rhamnella rubrinervis]|uniref:Uncharacterized protein n=1 Tax=Rhamnella rubrinervis TaxID=2594499 RepID=A0A8K0DRJ8_9ROSA|nr:hypothetical protein FNV43_RR22440 [Rhamnella rubrinervis]
MVSDTDLVTRLRDILKSSDLDTATAGSVRRQLEEDFGVDLSDKKAFIRDQIDIFLESHMVKPEDQQLEEDNEAEVREDSENVEHGAMLEVREEEENNEDEEEKDESEAEDSKKAGENQVDKVKKRGGFNKICSLSPQLQEFVGEPVMARTEVVKKIWSYIREHDLQDPKNRRNIKCDESLYALFRVNTINMFQMNKALSKHIWPLGAEDENVKPKIKGEESDHSDSEGSNTEEQEGEKEEEEDEKDSSGRGRKKRGKFSKGDKSTKRRGGGFTKLCSLSPQLQTFIGDAVLARTEVVKRLWNHIRENNLQDPKNKRNIICDESLHALFCVDSIDMFQMNKALSKHIWPLNDEAATPDNSSQKEKQSIEEKEEAVAPFHCSDSDEEPKQKEKRQKKGGSGLLAPLQLSDALVEFFGTGESELSRGDAVKRMWEYIKKNDLQDPSDRRRVICDDKLKELFKVDNFIGFSIARHLKSHFIKAE